MTPRWRNSDQSASVKLGVRMARKDASAYMFIAGDQPLLTPEAIDILVRSWKESPDRIIAPVYGADRGNPVVFPARFTQDLLALEGDTGGRAVMEQNPQCLCLVRMPDPAAGTDVDTPEEYSRCKKLHERI